ncbi:MAG: cytochrome c biogenesis protein CcsA [Acidibacillus sp.]|uniref:Cytochrome c biogenesis protein CcsA n=1 Tax=Sulfoacidibacillus ferrooxidans TaxID=2005001 RepID=A0A9X1V8H3_9BACL|nr:cytochrome c biogenesis protein CcsA [Sulfoacidibacillus ferrooxidans]MCI0183209.1 Cytochrome c biogenesis protein CcsA [Sulfoacidibacillus ferrooxidans]MCY0893082.1 cytochrome c biogenesis protein CcsA [Acidibacillus sp.]
MAFLHSSMAYLLMIGLYAVSIILFYLDFLHDNRIASRLGLAMLSLVWIVVTMIMGGRMIFDRPLVFFSSGQVIVLFAWLLITVSLIVNYFSAIDYFTLFMNILGFIFAIFDAFVHSQSLEATYGQHDLLLLHIGVALLSYIAFTLSFMFSLLYVLEDSALRLKRFQSGSFRRLPPLERLDVYAYRSAVIGLPLLLLGMILGALWYFLLSGHVVLFDPKPIGAFFLVLLYGFYAYARSGGWITGRIAAWVNLSCFFVVLINFLVVGELASDFHRW